jgi:hypothetical protein
MLGKNHVNKSANKVGLLYSILLCFGVSGVVNDYSEFLLSKSRICSREKRRKKASNPFRNPELATYFFLKLE